MSQIIYVDFKTGEKPQAFECQFCNVIEEDMSKLAAHQADGHTVTFFSIEVA